MSKSRIFLYFCLAFVVGIAVSSFIFIPQLALLGFLILGIFLIAVFWRHKKLTIFGFCFLFLALGIWRNQQALSKIIYPEEQTVAFTGLVAAEPDVRDNNTKLKVQKGKLKILVTADRYPEYQYGDKLKISGLLEKPPVFEGFNYRDYLKKDGIYAVMNRPKIELVEGGQGNIVMAALIAFKNKFQETSEKFIPSPQIGILEALFSGDEGNISKEWKEKLNITGTRHIAAVSGMNITIIASLIASFAPFYATMSLLFLYILMIGAPASAVRALIMAAIFILAKKLGRLSSASRAVFFAATFMLAVNPLLLRLDIGFQLSFLAILGLIYFQQAIFRFLKKIPDPKLFPVRATLASTLAAQIFTFPVLIYNFGYIPVLSPITNILIVPLLAPVTILIFVFGLAAMIFPPLGYLLSWPVWLSLTYIIKIINLFS